MIKGVLFDLDGTLINSIDDLAMSMNFILKSYGFKTHEVSSYKQFVGDGTLMLAKRSLPVDSSDDLIKDVEKAFLDYYATHDDVETRLYEGIDELLKWIMSNGLKLAIVTNKNHERMLKVVDKLLSQYTFDFLIGDGGHLIKPNPYMIHETLAALEVNKDECLFIGDSNVDIQTAKNASMKSVGVTWGFRGRDELSNEGAKYIIDHPAELIDIIKNN